VELPELIAILRRRWWLVVLVPLLTAGLLAWQSRNRPYQVSVRATVLIPGDTEIPGSSERPELMVLDDLPSLVDSRVFAEGVRVAMRATDLTIEDVQSSLDGVRYSRVLTVLVTRDDATEATEIAEAVSLTLPDLVNRYLIPDGGAAATVKVIDPPGDPTRSRPDQVLKFGVLLIAAVGIGAGLALLADRVDPRLRGRDQIERAFGAPVLADLRRRGRRSRTVPRPRKGAT
jgi:capsular polysaccharide biosynthesis protein